MANPHIYKVTGTLKFCDPDVMSESAKHAKEVVEWMVQEQLKKGYPELIEILNLEAESLRLATKEEVIDGWGEEFWED